MLSACGHSKQMEIKAADISDLEKNRMDVAASQAFTAEAINIGEGISTADMYIEHYQKGKLVERFGPVRADYSEEKPDTIQFVYFENEEDKQGNIAADSSVKRDDSATQEMTQNISSPEPITFEKPALIGSSIRGTDETMHTSEHKKELIKHQDALLYYVELHH
ncbi:hypothetical protein [Bacillus subtilis]|uniref:hypothetical protein n=1 Tax=Bacillus subtilis TaxID=1423 RepID=UPI003F84A28E